MYMELLKLLKNKNFYISAACLLLLVIGAVVLGVKDYRENVELFERIYHHNPNVSALASPHLEWVGLGGFRFNVLSSLYYFLFPLLLSIPLVDSIDRERKSGNIHYQLTRMGRGVYFRRKFVFSYISAFFLFLLPLVLGVVLVNLLTNHWDYSGFSQAYRQLVHGTLPLPDNSFEGEKKSLFSPLLEISPYWYVLAYYVIGGLFAGGYVCLGLAFSLFLKNRYLITLMPQIIYMVCWAALTITNQLAWDPFNFLIPSQPVEGLSYWKIVIVFILQLLIAVGVFSYGVKKSEDVL
ncbi:NADH dehydrogenase FAD-containing subunit [Geobacillus stearothermophilus]|uniref:NADH dehydrogenase FAD-containing subunit n=1 Tax=Geobacillus stearothermophilus TaxID=1422 RepID=UPI002E21DDC7|nr:NADH dehydrogenase FAD-containing subunit [Geobacillus stearothermophilus]